MSKGEFHDTSSKVSLSGLRNRTDPAYTRRIREKGPARIGRYNGISNDPLGAWFGGYGVTSFAIADMNEDGDPELYFTYSWGSGIHRSQVGYFDTAAKELVSFEFTDIGNDCLLKFDENSRLCVYRADCKVNSFVDIKLSATVKTAEILWDSEKISLAEEAKKPHD